MVKTIEQSKDTFDFEKLVAALKSAWADLKVGKKKAFVAKPEVPKKVEKEKDIQKEKKRRKKPRL